MGSSSLFGLLIVDRDPYYLADLPGLAQAWLIDAGGFGMIGASMRFRRRSDVSARATA